MAINDRKVTTAEVNTNHVQAAADRPTGTAAQNKEIFDKLPELIVERHNGLCDDVQTDLDTKVPKKSGADSYTYLYAHNGDGTEGNIKTTSIIGSEGHIPRLDSRKSFLVPKATSFGNDLYVANLRYVNEKIAENHDVFTVHYYPNDDGTDTTFADALSAYNAGKTLMCTVHGVQDYRLGCSFISETDGSITDFIFINHQLTDDDLREIFYQLSSDSQLTTYTTDYAGISDKVNKIAGRGLSEKNYTSAEKTKLAGIEDGADVTDTANVASAGAEMTSNKVTSVSSSSTDTQYPSAKCVYDELAGKVDKVSGKGLSTEDYTSAEKTKLSGIEAGAQVNVITTDAPSDNKSYARKNGAWSEVTGGGSSAWGQITGTLSDQTDLQTALDGKQPTLTSGTNIKTINNSSILGSGNVDTKDVAFLDTSTATYSDVYNAYTAGKMLIAYITDDEGETTYYPLDYVYQYGEGLSFYFRGVYEVFYTYCHNKYVYINTDDAWQTEITNIVPQVRSMPDAGEDYDPEFNGLVVQYVGEASTADFTRGHFYESYRSSSSDPYEWREMNVQSLTGYATEAWVGQQGFGTYTKPASGIPSTDLTSAVQISLTKADTALQSVPATYRTSAEQDMIDATKEPTSNKVTSLSSSSTDTEYPSAKCVYDAINEQYELIEEITLTEDVASFVRTQDTQGNPYNFKKMFVYMHATPSAAANKYFQYYCDNNSKLANCMQSRFTDAGEERYSISELDLSSGHGACFVAGGSKYELYRSYTQYGNDVHASSITGFKFNGALATGSVIKIYGIKR